MNQSLAVIIPTYHEVENVRKLIPSIAQVIAKVPSTTIDFEIIIVDDNSQDGVEECISLMRKSGIPVSIIVRKHDRGLSSAVLRGIQSSQKDICLVMDADFQHPPNVIPRFWKMFQNEKINFVAGHRISSNEWPLHRKFISAVASSLAYPITSCNDPMTGLFAIKRQCVIDNLASISPVGYKIALELIVKCNFAKESLEEVSYEFGLRQYGESKLSGKVIFQYILHLSQLYTYQYGLQLALFLVCLCILTYVAIY